MKWLTDQEKRFIFAIVGLLLVGGLVKAYRAAHPVGELKQLVKP